MEMICGYVLTKSYMKKARCVTLYNPQSQKIVRIVSDEDCSPIPEVIAEQFNVLDYIEATVIARCPKGPQQENIYVDCSSICIVSDKRHSESQRSFLGRIYLLSHCKLWLENQTSFMNNNAYAMDSVEEYDHSVELVYAKNLVLKKEHGKIKAYFSSESGFHKHYSVTDPVYLKRCSETQEEIQFEKSYLIVSIPAEPFEKDGQYYKFIAAIYPVS